MPRAFVIAILSVGFLTAFAIVPSAIGPLVAPGISGSAHATDPNTSQSNTSRMGGGPGKKAATAKTGKGTPTGGTTNKAINLNSSRSNTP